MSEVWKRVKKISGLKYSSSINILKINNITVPSSQDIAKTLAFTFEQHSSSENYDINYRDYKLKKERTILSLEESHGNPLSQPLTIIELNNSLQDMKNSSPEPDNIPVVFLKYLSILTKQHLLQIFNKIWQQRQCPYIWAKATVLPFLKSRKPRLDQKSYRSISPTCAIAKLMKKIVNARLMWTLEKSHFFLPEQNGFRRTRSAIDNIVYL
ncbi:uncharacterized protein [Diabrotica undecimpunctata]|uniref:uncharacterized protein n=1 Tax=Diabrotica undecimpunctata TaxID=50387 RepID=UPI003B631AFF